MVFSQVSKRISAPTTWKGKIVARIPRPSVIKDAKILDQSDLIILPIRLSNGSKPQPQWPDSLKSKRKERLESFISKLNEPFKERQALFAPDMGGLSILIIALPQKFNTFDALTISRMALKQLGDFRWMDAVVDLRHLGENSNVIADGLISALYAQDFHHPKFLAKEQKSTKPRFAKIRVLVDEAQQKNLSAVTAKSYTLCESTNLVRHLVHRPANDLTPAHFCKEAAAMARELNCKSRIFRYPELVKMGAGAFTAVSQGSAHEDASIVHLSYSPKNGKNNASGKRIAVVGKGVTFDTGGVNLKPARYMYGMHTDMTGAAVALGILKVAVEEQWPHQLDVYLAVAENAIGPKSYYPNQVVKALNGKTIEIIHTDAEGRMMLADTLTLASREKPDIILDFATLTGACVGAISNRYAGVFTDDERVFEIARQAGIKSGERAWPFPMDADFGEALKSDVADVKQCRLSGGVDHIEAAIFLRKFIEHKPIWAHIDLSAAECEGGLAHVDDQYTGFGVRLGTELLNQLLNL
jgi:leucyl aminopeptidase